MILSLQYMRAVAALMVVAYHIGAALQRTGGSADTFSFAAGNAGVDIFFVLSGFIILQSTRENGVGPIEFLWRRIVRIVPLYWLLTLLIANVAIIAPSVLKSTQFDGWHLLASLGFVPFEHPTLHEPLPLLIPGWTLNYEMAFYAVFGLALLFPQRLQVPAVLGVLIAAVSVRWLIPYNFIGAFYTLPIILEFGCGMLIAEAYRNGVRISVPVCALFVGVGSLGLATLVQIGTWRSFTCGLPTALVVIGVVFLERERAFSAWRFPLFLGNASYSIYLTHVLAIPLVSALAAERGMPADAGRGYVFLAVALAASIAVGSLCHLFLERPLLLLFKRPSKAADGRPGRSRSRTTERAAPSSGEPFAASPAFHDRDL